MARFSIIDPKAGAAAILVTVDSEGKQVDVTILVIQPSPNQDPSSSAFASLSGGGDDSSSDDSNAFSELWRRVAAGGLVTAKLHAHASSLLREVLSGEDALKGEDGGEGGGGKVDDAEGKCAGAEQDPHPMEVGTLSGVDACVARLAALGWAFEENWADPGEAGLLRSLTDDACPAASPSLLPDATLGFLAVRDVVDAFLPAVMVERWGLRQVLLPLSAAGAEQTAVSPVTTSVFISPDLATAKTVLLLIMGKGGSRAGAWVSRVVIHCGIQAGSIFPYLEKAKQREWGVVVLNPNAHHVVVAKGEGVGVCADLADTNTAGPASTEVLNGFREMGFPDEAAHRACLATRSLELEDCGLWLQSMLGGALDICAELSVAERASSVVPVPENSNAVDHVRHVYERVLPLLGPRKANLLIAGTSYAGFSVTRLLDAVGAGVAVERGLKGIAMGDSSHFLDCKDHDPVLLKPTTAAFLAARSRNWIPAEEEMDTFLGTRLHMDCVSANEEDHGKVPGAIVDSVFTYLDSCLDGTMEALLSSS